MHFQCVMSSNKHARSKNLGWESLWMGAALVCTIVNKCPGSILFFCYNFLINVEVSVAIQE